MQCLWCGPLRWTKKFRLDGVGNPAVTQENLARSPGATPGGVGVGAGAGAGEGRRARFCLGRWPFKVGVPGTKARPENRPESLQFLRPRPPHPAPSHPGLPAVPRGPPLGPGGLRSARARWARASPDPCRRLTPAGVGRGLAAGTPGSGPPSLGLSFHIHKPGRSLSGGRVSGLLPKAKRTPSLVLFPSEVRGNTSSNRSFCPFLETRFQGCSSKGNLRFCGGTCVQIGSLHTGPGVSKEVTAGGGLQGVPARPWCRRVLCPLLAPWDVLISSPQLSVEPQKLGNCPGSSELASASQVDLKLLLSRGLSPYRAWLSLTVASPLGAAGQRPPRGGSAVLWARVQAPGHPF
ncbi:uncharacterized protein LOC125960440 [Orcinus orca]|uniref:uncharacterized protein LOC125960440 n=1 Tax=Orcinus orca TaxID=9733 RepID=UPI0021129472|nr:uncharacterized protein LOC125960440 [Orcinus orca]